MFKLFDDLVGQLSLKLATLSAAKRLQALVVSLTIIFLVFALLQYKIYYDSKSCLERISFLNKQFLRAKDLLQKKADLDSANSQLVEWLGKNVPSGSMKSVIEKAVTDFSLELEPGWKEKIKIVNFEYADKLEAEEVAFSVAKLSVKQLVEFLNYLRTQYQVQIRDLDVKHKGDCLTASFSLFAYKIKAA